MCTCWRHSLGKDKIGLCSSSECHNFLETTLETTCNRKNTFSKWKPVVFVLYDHYRFMVKVPTVWAIDQYRMYKEVLERSMATVDSVQVLPTWIRTKSIAWLRSAENWRVHIEDRTLVAWDALICYDELRRFPWDCGILLVSLRICILRLRSCFQLLLFAIHQLRFRRRGLGWTKNDIFLWIFRGSWKGQKVCIREIWCNFVVLLNWESQFSTALQKCLVSRNSEVLSRHSSCVSILRIFRKYILGKFRLVELYLIYP
jgi:hypothetical protein